MHRPYGMFGATDQIKIIGRNMITLVARFKTRHSIEYSRLNHNRRYYRNKRRNFYIQSGGLRDFFQFLLISQYGKSVINQSKLHKHQIALEIRKTRAGNQGGALVVNQTQTDPETHMIFRLEIKLARRTPLTQNFIMSFVFPNRRVRRRNIGY